MDPHPEEGKAYQNRGLFSDDYLEHRLPQSPEWEDDVSGIYGEFLELYEGKKEQLGALNEANTETEFLEPALRLLGFHFVKQTKTRGGEKPDYALFGDEADKGAASGHQNDFQKFYAPALALVEGKYWGRDLDVHLKGDGRDLIKYKSSPEMQIVSYLQATEMPWGILTNGKEWRLYYGNAPGKTKRYYSVDLVRALESEESFRRFYLFFRREAFVQKGPESKSFLQQVLEGSEAYAVRVGKELKKVVFERLFPGLAKGFLEYHRQELGRPVDEEALEKIYRGTLALMYRLLFLLYAEARDLLPAGDRLGYGARGINRIKGEVAGNLDRGHIYTRNGYGIWQDLTDLFRIVDEGDRELKVPPYNGGLFKDEGSHEFLGTHKVPDFYLAHALDELSRQADETGERQFVDYGFVGVRELGSVYEGLLEFSLTIADEDLAVVREKGREVYVPKSTNTKRSIGEVEAGEPYLVNDKRERKATGSYYTPGYVVDYIVENTLGPLVGERRKALRAKLGEIGKLEGDLRRMRKSEEYVAERVRGEGALDTLLDVKVLDPAMGSGHFLVAAVDYLTDQFSRVIDELDAAPVVEELDHLREEIRGSLESYGAGAGRDQLSDANLLKRMVMKRCIYGVDLNEMAVELAKLSLWLDAFTVGAPLSFLDHHLKRGNSLIGSSVREVRQEVEGAPSLLGNQFTALLIQGTELMQHVGETPDATEGEVRESIRSYERADEILKPYKLSLDIWTSEHFDNSGARSFLIDEVSSGGAEALLKGDYGSFTGRNKEVIDTAFDLADAKRFFHWELEFPEVFYEGARERETPGFDAVVGNPPYFSISDLSSLEKRYLKSAYSEVYAGNSDILYYFVGQGLEGLRRQGNLGFILARYYAEARFAEGLRNYILGRSQLKKLVDFQNFQVFPTANVLTNILILKRTDVPDRYRGNVLRIKDDKESAEAVEKALPLEDESLFSSFEFDSASLSGALWSFSDTLAQAIKDRMSSGAGQLDRFFEVVQAMQTGMNQVLVVDEQTARQHRLEESLLKPLAKTGNVRRYYIEDLRKYVLWTEVDDISAFPNTMRYLTPHRDALAARHDIRARGADWWRISNPRNADLFSSENPRILTPFMSTSNKFHLDTEKHYNDGGDLRGIFPRENNPFDMYFVLALLNSKAGEFFHKNTAKLKRGGYYEYYSKPIGEFPIPRIQLDSPQHARSASVRQFVDLYEAGDFEQLDSMVKGIDDQEGLLAHDLLSYLGERMTVMHEQRAEIERGWREWVEAAVPQQHKLTKEFRERGWVEAGIEEGWPGVLAGFQEKGAVPGAKVLQDLKRETEEALGKLRPLYERIRSTDWLIDQIVYRLYGLTEEEIRVVEAGAGRDRPG